MEVTCPRCQHTLTPDSNYCAACGLPQLVYSSTETPGPISLEPGNEAVLDAGEIVWKPAIQAALIWAVPVGLFCSTISPIGFLRLVLMTVAAAWVVTVYIRRVEPPWITASAGARIGLVSGILSGWAALAISGIGVFVQRFVLHQGTQLDAEWKAVVDQSQQVSAQISPQMSADAAFQESFARQIAWMRSANGQAGYALIGLIVMVASLLCFSMLGGVIGARLSARIGQMGK